MPKKKETPLDSFVFQNNAKVAEADRRVLAKFAISQAYDCLNYATQALRSMNRTWWCLNQLVDASKRMVESGLVLGPAAEEARIHIEEQVARLAVLEPVLQDLADDRSGRLVEITDWEQAMHQEYARQIRAKQAKAKPKKAAKTERQLLPREEPSAPGMDLDPKVLAATIKSLRALDRLDDHEE